jgi:hypothetical protein
MVASSLARRAAYITPVSDVLGPVCVLLGGACVRICASIQRPASALEANRAVFAVWFCSIFTHSWPSAVRQQRRRNDRYTRLRAAIAVPSLVAGPDTSIAGCRCATALTIATPRYRLSIKRPSGTYQIASLMSCTAALFTQGAVNQISARIGDPKKHLTSEPSPPGVF